MAGQSIPTTSPDVEAWLITTFAAALAPALLRNRKPTASLPNGSPNPEAVQPLILIRADLQGHVTPISRYCRVSAQAWALHSDGSGDLKAAQDLAAAFGALVVAAPREGLLLEAGYESGPYRALDQATRVEYSVVNLLLEVTC